MVNPVELEQRLARLDADSRESWRGVVAEYESELDQVTQHLSQIYEELILLYEVGSDIASSLDPSDIAQRAIDRMRDLLSAGGGAIALADLATVDPGDSVILGAEGVVSDQRGLLEWATRQTLTKDRSLILNDLQDSEAPTSGGSRSLISAPLRSRGRLIGAVIVLDKQSGDGFSTEDQKLLQTIASQIGVAIENSQLYRREQEHAQHLEAAYEELEDTYDQTLAALSGALDLRDNETEGHARRVTRYSVRIAREMGFDGASLVPIERGALMHDIGKIGVPDSILLKPAKLTDEEWAVMRTHPHLGFRMIRNIGFLSDAAPIVLHHHERFDGGGYPDGLAGEAIPIGARIFAIADTFDAMTSDRPYRKALPYQVAREEIEKCAVSQFDPTAVEAFCAVHPAEWDAIRELVDTQLALKRQDTGADDATV